MPGKWYEERMRGSDALLLVARDEEMRLVHEVASFEGAAAAVVIEGEAGIGKTALWRAGLDVARASGAEVLAAAAAESEARFAYAPLADLLRGTPPSVREALPPQQRNALERALLLGGEHDGDIELHAVSAAFLNLLVLLADCTPLVVAIDDVQWLDAASATVLSFALRRAPKDQVRFLLTRRSDAAGAQLRDGLGEAAFVELQPLTVGALQRLLLNHGHAMSGLAVRRVYEQSGGNPYFALEMSRAIARRGGSLDRLGAVPVPETLLGLLDEHVAGLDAAGELAVLATAITVDPLRRALAEALGGTSGLDAAEAAGLLVQDDDRMRLAHPLVGTAARARAAPADLRRLHGALSKLADSPEERARHLALGAEPPDANVAAALEAAASAADARGATSSAAELSREAVRFTPAHDDSSRRARVLAAADRHMRAGLLAEGLALLRAELDAFPPGEDRVRAEYHLLQLDRRDLDLDAWERVAAEAKGSLRAEILAELSFCAAAGAVERLGEARQWADEALALAEAEADAVAAASAGQSLAFVRAMQGDSAPAFAMADVDVPATLPLTNAPARVAAVAAIWRGDTARAAELVDGLLEEALQRGEEWAAAMMLLHRFELEARQGDAQSLLRTIDRFERVTGVLGPLLEETLPRMRAFVSALEGDVEGARGHASVDAAPWQKLEAQRAVGLALLFAGDAARASRELLAVVERAASAGVRDPGVFPAAGDAAEALLLAGDHGRACALAEELERKGRELEHPWAQVVGARVRGLTAAAAADAETWLRRALELHEALDLPLDEARALFALGSLLRRERRLRDARELLEQALAAFERLGVPPLAARARNELARIPGRRSAAGLTPAEAQVAELAARGKSNREIAAALFVTPKVVERHLTRVYAKLGLRTRAELARLAGESGGIPRLEEAPAET
jgi:DNA-binding CsgD family transcriptional regulator